MKNPCQIEATGEHSTFFSRHKIHFKEHDITSAREPFCIRFLYQKIKCSSIAACQHIHQQKCTAI